jgi:hypothetical protein
LDFLKTLRLSFFFSNTARAKNPKQREEEATRRKKKEN